jgi:hypothetical protein
MDLPPKLEEFSLEVAIRDEDRVWEAICKLEAIWIAHAMMRGGVLAKACDSPSARRVMFGYSRMA